jgi:hypothetical protein
VADTLSGLTIYPGGMTAVWEPEIPRQLTKTQLEHYRRERDELLGELVGRMGIRIAVIEV